MGQEARSSFQAGGLVLNSIQCHHICVAERRKKERKKASLFSYIAFFIHEVLYRQHIIKETLRVIQKNTVKIPETDTGVPAVFLHPISECWILVCLLLGHCCRIDCWEECGDNLHDRIFLLFCDRIYDRDWLSLYRQPTSVLPLCPALAQLKCSKPQQAVGFSRQLCRSLP